jgi:hypothetical protein
MGGNKRNSRRARSEISKDALACAKRAAAKLTAERQRDAAVKVPAVLPVDDPIVTKPARDRLPSKPVTDELMEKLVKRQIERERAADEFLRLVELQARWSHKQGTPETHERVESVPPRRRQSPLVRMYQLGKIDADDLAAAQEISHVIEMIERDVSVRGMTLDDRVDCNGAGHNVLVEGLRRIRAEVAYHEWRKIIPTPKRMIIDMIVSDVSYVRQAKRYGMRWETARKRLISALRIWHECHAKATKLIDRDDVEAVYQRLGEQF